MNPNTGHLVDLDMYAPVDASYSRIPKALQNEAARALKGASEVYVDMESNSRLANWAKKKRDKAKKKVAAASRKRNRK